MIDFIWDKDVSVSLTRRVARLGLISFSWLVVCGVLASIVLPLAKPSLRKVSTGDMLAAVSSKSAVKSVVVNRPPGVELIHDAASTSTASPNVVWMTVTAYCPCPICCGKGAHGVTASGKPVTANYGHFVAAPAQFSFGTKLIIPGYDHTREVPVLDRGGAIKGDCLDVFFPDHEMAKKWGRQRLPVTIVPPPATHDAVALIH
jgi:3D (Asp-Asp-Asp) domain-containing protein